MSYRKTFKLVCGLAGGSAVLLVTAAAADSRGYFGEQRGETAARWPRLAVLRAAQPAWTPAKHTPAPSGHAWDFNWDKYDFCSNVICPPLSSVKTFVKYLSSMTKVSTPANIRSIWRTKSYKWDIFSCILALLHGEWILILVTVLLTSHPALNA